MATAEEIAAKYLAGSQEPEKENKADQIASKYLGAKKPDVAPPPPQQQDGPGLLRRSMGNFQQGLSDAMSTMAGDSFGRSGDPTQRDFQNMGPYETTGRRLLKAVGGDAIPALGAVAGDALITGGKAVLPAEIQQGIGEAYKTVSESAPAQYIGNSLDRLREMNPEAYATANELVNVGAAFLPVKKLKLKKGRLENVGDVSVKRLRNTVQKERAAAIQKSLEPSEIFQAGKVNVTGPNKRYEYVPKSWEARMYKEVDNVPGYDPFKNSGENIAAIDRQVDILRNQLDEGLPKNVRIKGSHLSDRLEETAQRLIKKPMLGKDAKRATKDVMAMLDEIIDPLRQPDGSIRPIDLLDARRRLDDILTRENKGLFGDAVTGSSVAAREIRKAINDIVDEAAPSAEVKKLLSRQSDLLEANSILRPRADFEARTMLGRGTHKVEADTGLAPAKSPHAVGMNITSPIAAGVVGVGTAASLGTRRLRNAIRTGDVMAAQGVQSFVNSTPAAVLADILRNGSSAAQRAAILSQTRKDEENY